MHVYKCLEVCADSLKCSMKTVRAHLAQFGKFFSPCTLLTNIKSSSNSNQIFRMTEAASFPDLIYLNRVLKSEDLLVPSASLLTLASFLKQFLSWGLGKEGERVREGIFNYR